MPNAAALEYIAFDWAGPVSETLALTYEDAYDLAEQEGLVSFKIHSRPLVEWEEAKP